MWKSSTPQAVGKKVGHSGVRSQESGVRLPRERQTEKTNFHSAKSPQQNTGYERPVFLVSIAAIFVQIEERCCRRNPIDKGRFFRTFTILLA
jgi:hypothetical protein